MITLSRDGSCSLSSLVRYFAVCTALKIGSTVYYKVNHHDESLSFITCYVDDTLFFITYYDDDSLCLITCYDDDSLCLITCYDDDSLCLITYY